MEIKGKSKETKSSGRKDNLILLAILLGALFLSYGDPYTMITGNTATELPEGQTVEIPFKYTYTNDYFFGDSTKARIALDYSGIDEDDEYPLVWSVEADKTYETSFDLDVKGEVGDEYKIYVMVEEYDSARSKWVDATDNDYTLSVTVVDPEEYEEESDSSIDEIDFDSAIITGSVLASGALVLIVGIILWRRKK
nr:hypothetical protein [uncultured Methanolobus sp.]